jgi:KH domain
MEVSKLGPSIPFLSASYAADHSSHPVRSIVAQAYLELIRAWTVNTTDRWLFGRVSSAGTNVRTQFSTNVAKVPAWELPGRPVVENWITELSGSRSYFWSEDGPREKETILNKIREWKRCGLRQLHFTRYLHILCFDKATYVILMKMKALAQDPLAPPPLASEKTDKEQPLSSGKDSKIVDSTIHFLGPQESFKVPLAKTIEGVKLNIKNFLITQFNWVRPPNNMGIADGPNRTQFLWIQSGSIGRIIGKGGAKRKSLEEQSKCRIIIGRQSPDEEVYGRMVAIVGKMAAVEKAKGLVLETAGAA